MYIIVYYMVISVVSAFDAGWVIRGANWLS